MNLNKSAPSRDDVLYEFSLARQTPDAELLDQFVRLYPEHAAALTDLAIGIVLDGARGNDDNEAESLEPAVSPAVSRAMSRFQNRLYEVHGEKAAPATGARPQAVQNPFTALGRSEFRALASRLHGNTVFVGMLRDREIDADTMSDGFKRLVADEVRAPLDLVVSHFAAQSESQAGQFYKSGDKPRSGPKVSFEEAVRRSGLTEDDQKYLLSL